MNHINEISSCFIFINYSYANDVFSNSSFKLYMFFFVFAKARKYKFCANTINLSFFDKNLLKSII